MGNVYLLDCTLRDGGYINNWQFGRSGIQAIIRKLEQTGIEMIEVGFIKGNDYNPDQTLFPDVETIKQILPNKKDGITYVGMLDMSAPVPIERITPYDGTSIDGIRVIFKKDKIDEAYDACAYIKKIGYKVFVNFVSTDSYTDKEFIEGIEKFNKINPDGVTIVDTFGMIKRKQFMRLIAIADNNLNQNAMLCYHAHNNLQQAYGNAEAMVEMNMSRDIVIDACVFGMGRGAGNLNLELFAEYMNDNFGKSYKIAPILEIMDEYLSEFYKTKFWGYSLPLYLSATHGCHPKYAIYLAEKNSLSEKAFNELLKGIGHEDKYIFSKEKAEEYYKKYMECYFDDTKIIEELSKAFEEKKVVLIAPGKTITEYKEKILEEINEKTIVVAINFYDEAFSPEYVFAGNIRRFNKIIESHQAKIITTSNIPEHKKADYTINFLSVTGESNEVFDNSGLMALRMMENIGVKEISIAGMDGFSDSDSETYYDKGFGAYHTSDMSNKNTLVSNELKKLNIRMKLNFITPTNYSI